MGYEECGQLTEVVRRKPYSVVLFDEIEKAHPDVFNILLQVLDDGRLTDNKGREVDFKNTIIIMTSNIGSHIIQEGFEKMTDENREPLYDVTRKEVFELLRKTIRPEFLNRIDDIIMFKPLTRDEIRQIAVLQFRTVKKMLLQNGIKIERADNAADYLADLGYDPQYGARPVKRVLQREVLNELSKMILSGEINREDIIIVDVKDGLLVFENKA